ncbi:PREDICTED: uncharacterized protein LOC103319337 [Prunus mume]|uniref:Uncharacterized protein LOC103319337 n=1 Tax=Prunus mume TaxID=102107 RepID=A0ABM0N3P7_PRUMU|nr:PREDICTED: uncharacterized protein LOC103319337 [Prunus mume]
MSVISLTCSQTTLCYSSKPPHSFLTDFENSVFPRTSIPAFALKLSAYSQRLLRNGNLVSRRNRFHANSADSDADTNELETQLSRENGAVSSNGGNPSTSFLSVLCPLLKLFSGGDPSQERNFTLEVATSSLSTFARFPWGSRSLSQNLDRQDITTLDPPMHLQLFEFEACPFCRRVREALTELDLSAEVYPCPKGSVRHREMVKRFGGKEQFPFLIDPNTGISMYESGEIVKYLFEQYGKGRKPTVGLLESTLFTGWMPTIFRAGRGMTLWEKAKRDPPPKKLELYSYENNPYARIVREALCELELPYILQNVGEGSLRSKSLDASGSKEVPYLIDPNTGTQVGDYKKILSYLFQTYSAAIV